MPIKSVEDIKKLVISGSIGGITLDTSIIEKYQYGFEEGVLATMSQFSRIDAYHLVLDIVLHEIKSHLVKESEAIKSQVKNSLKPLGNSWGIDKKKRIDALSFIFDENTGIDVTNDRIDAFLNDTSALLINCAEYVDISEVISLYMNTRPPFGNKTAKKNEFPDAIALLALERWSKKNRTAVIAVSGDSDWKNFCEESDYIYLLENLPQALTAFQADADGAAKTLNSMLDDGKIQALNAAIDAQLNHQTDQIDIIFEATSAWYYEQYLENIEITPKYDYAEQIKEFRVLEYENNTLVIQTIVETKLTALFNVNFYHSDQEDRIYSRIGDAEVKCEQATPLSLTITFIFEHGTATIDSISLQPLRITMDFGDIEPDWLGDFESEEI